MRKVDVSIISPAHNEEKMVEDFVKSAVDFIRGKKLAGEVIIVENGSKDRTLLILKKLQATYPELVVFSMPSGNKGLALKRGMEIARGKYLVHLDTDLWDDDFVASSLYNLQKYDVVVGSKVIAGSRDGRPLSARLMNQGYNFVMRLFFDFQGTETHAKLSFRKDVILPLVKECRTADLVFDTELILRAERDGLSKLEVPTQVREIRPRRFSLADQLVKTVKNFWILLRALGPRLNWAYILVFGAVILGGFLRFYQYHNWFFFSVDEEHYSYMTRMITVDRHFPLIGGPISGTKLYMAPWFLYFNAIWFFLSGNDPVFSGMVFAAAELLVVVLVYLIGKRMFSRRVGAFAAVLYGGSLLMALFDRHYWNITLAPAISTLTVYGLLNWLRGDQKWLVMTAVVVGFGLSTTFSLFAVFLFGVVVILVHDRKAIIKFLTVISVMHITLVLFDLRHNFWLLRGLAEFFTKHSYDSVPFFQRAVNTLTVFVNTLGKSLAITTPLDLSDEISICKENIVRYQPVWWATGLALAGLAGYLMNWVRGRFQLKSGLILILGLVNIASLFLFRADPAERHWLPFLPMFFITLGILLDWLWSKNIILKISVAAFIGAVLVVNFRSLINSTAPYGITEKEKAVWIISQKTKTGEFYLDSVGECHKWGYRYLFSEFNHEPAGSYLDDSFSWMYSSPPTPQNVKVRVTIFTPNKIFYERNF